MSDHDLALTLRQIVEFADEIATLVCDACAQRFGYQSRVPSRLGALCRIHGYDVVMADVLWDVAANDIPKLRGEIKLLLEK